jgi:hypothetical protein
LRTKSGASWQFCREKISGTNYLKMNGENDPFTHKKVKSRLDYFFHLFYHVGGRVTASTLCPAVILNTSFKTPSQLTTKVTSHHQGR